ncbi:MAG: hypothetical protein KC466_00900 [Myxococcales bacterium]|nr:hypothetical protein [Myxococcales bacterium]
MPTLDLAYYDALRLDRRNLGQRFVGWVLLWPQYDLWPGVEIVLEGAEHIPTREGGETVVLAMNHTDRYNYWPFQYKLWRDGRYPFTATWVKGKYYRNPWMARFFNATQNIPLPSLGYLIEEEYRAAMGRLPTRERYRELRDVVDGKRAADDPELSEEARRFTGAKVPDAAGEIVPYAEGIRRRFVALMTRVVRYTAEASEHLGFHLLVFPEGTRSVRLGTGRTGLMEYALSAGKRVVPVSCNGSDLVYSRNYPFVRRGRIVYRVGPAYDPRALLGPDERIGPYTPFTGEAARYRPIFERLTHDLMRRINGGLDARHRSEAYLP